MKKLIPALCMLLIAATLMGTSTFAWFSMNEQVTAQGMSVQAKAEEGLVISNTAGGSYAASADAVDTATKQLAPGSTADLTNWVTSTSTNPGQANTGEAYEAATSGTHYVSHTFYVRSSAASAMANTALTIQSVSVTSTQELSKSLRVGIKVEGDTNAYIYAPVTGFTPSYAVGAVGGGAGTTVTPKAADALSKTTLTSIPGSSNNGIAVTIYLWFEGEDASCISNNIEAVLETMNVAVTFGYASTVTP